jgi:hypothetical protein
MNCPLPIDWLDHLEGRDVDRDGLREHLANCRQCQLLVETLRERSVGVELTPYEGAALQFAPKWQEEKRSEVAVGDVWLTRGSVLHTYTELRRQIVLIVAKREEFNASWYSAAPLTIETEVATSTDLLLGAEDTTLKVPLAVQFRVQAPLARDQLDSYIGETTISGRSLLEKAAAGTLSSDHFGAAVAAADDSRLRRIEETRDLMARLTHPYGEALTKAEEEAGALEGSVEKAPDLAGFAETDEMERKFVVIELKRVAPSAPRRALALAAETVGLSNRWFSSFAGKSEQVRVRARLQLENPMRSDETLVLIIEDFSALWSPVRAVVALQKPSGERIESPPFNPQQEKSVVIARGGIGVLPTKVERLEVLLGV